MVLMLVGAPIYLNTSVGLLARIVGDVVRHVRRITYTPKLTLTLFGVAVQSRKVTRVRDYVPLYATVC